MDEFTPGNLILRERRGRVAYERYCVATGGVSAISGDRLPSWSAQHEGIREAWQRAAEAAFEEGRLFERERDGVAVRLQPGECLISYVYRGLNGSRVTIEVTTA